MKENVYRRIYLILLLPLMLFGCNSLVSNNGGKQIVITGHVVDKTSGQPISNAIVRITKPSPEIDDVTDSTGVFNFKVKIDSSVTYTIEARKEGYNIFSTTILAIPGRNVNLPVVKLQQAQDTSSSSQGSTNNNMPSGYAASIVLKSVSSNSVVVKESGGNESSNLTFQVQDSSGIPVDLNHAATVNFKFGSSPGGGEALNPVQATTNGNGEVVSTLTSGTKAGVVQVIAQATVNGKIIRSKPVPVAINAGLPDQSHFTLVSSQYNIPFPAVGAKYQFTCYAGDKYGNVVTDGVAIYFTTNAGYIEGSATTGTDGSASVNLIDGKPLPPGGIGSIIASTADANYNTITDTCKVLFSQKPIITVSPQTFNIPDGGSQTFSYSVMDVNGFPMAQGTNISVSITGKNINTTGDLKPQIIDVSPDFSNINQLTKFSFTISDAKPGTAQPQPVTITIVSNGPNGNSKVTLNGTSN